MKKFFLQFVLTLFIALILEQFLPWWSVAIAGAAGGFLFRAPYSFWCGFVAVAMLWLITAFYIDTQAAQPLSEQITQLLMMKSKWMLFVLTGIIGGLTGGLGAWSGAALRFMFTD